MFTAGENRNPRRLLLCADLWPPCRDHVPSLERLLDERDARSPDLPIVASGESAPPTSRLAPKSILQYRGARSTKYECCVRHCSSWQALLAALGSRRTPPRPSFQARLVGGLSHNPQATATIRHTLFASRANKPSNVRCGEMKPSLNRDNFGLGLHNVREIKDIVQFVPSNSMAERMPMMQGKGICFRRAITAQSVCSLRHRFAGSFLEVGEHSSFRPPTRRRSSTTPHH